MMDWVPAYGRSLINSQVWTAVNLSQALVNTASGGAAEFGTFEGEEEEFFVERIVGTVSAWAPGLDGDPISVCLRIQPLQNNLTTVVPQLPFNPGDGDSDYVANFRFWWERRYVVVPSVTSSDVVATQRTSSNEVDHPYWTQVDIRPKQLIGRRLNLWPCMTFWGNGALGETAEIRWSLRMLLKSVG